MNNVKVYPAETEVKKSNVTLTQTDLDRLSTLRRQYTDAQKALDKLKEQMKATRDEIKMVEYCVLETVLRK